MTAERWQRIEQLYHLALEHPPSERKNWLMEACAGDDQLRSEIETLLEANNQAEGFLTGNAQDWE
jgi:serine/threonine-protein kinase